MTATREDIEKWFDKGIKKGATHMIVICDSYEYFDYPKYVMPGQDAKKMSENLGEMQNLMEVYNLNMNKQKQIGEYRAFNY